MSSDYTPASTFHSTVQLPSGGDARTAASVNTGLQALADNTKFLADTKVPNNDVAILNGPVTFNDDVTFNDVGTFNKRLTPGVDGAIGRRTQTLTDAGATTTIDCRTDYCMVRLTPTSNGVLRTLTIASTHSPQVGDRIDVHLIRDNSTTGTLRIRFSVINIAEFTSGSEAAEEDNEAALTLTYVGAAGSGFEWRVTSNSRFDILYT